MADLNDIRAGIDQVDLQIRDLLVKRLGLSQQVATAKAESGDTAIYRADREAAILESLGSAVSQDIKAEYLSVVRKIMETSRMYQYGLIYDWNESVFSTVKGFEVAEHPGKRVVVRLTREDRPNAMSAILSMVGDYGYNMERMELIETDAAKKQVVFELTIVGNVSQTNMKKLMFQLSQESLDFEILENQQ